LYLDRKSVVKLIIFYLLIEKLRKVSSCIDGHVTMKVGTFML